MQWSHKLSAVNDKCCEMMGNVEPVRIPRVYQLFPNACTNWISCMRIVREVSAIVGFLAGLCWWGRCDKEWTSVTYDIVLIYFQMWWGSDDGATMSAPGR